MKVISLFSGAGGLDLGLEAAGFDIAVCVENDPNAKLTLKHNRPKWKILEPGDVFIHSPREILRIGQLRPGEAFILSAGPPCQPFSKAALWVNGKVPGNKDSRAKTLSALMRIVEEALPNFIILENVELLLRLGKNSGYLVLQKEIARINRQQGTKYKWLIFKINAADYGVPQTRIRIFLLADREGRSFTLPERTHFPPDRYQTKPTHVTAWEAIGDLDRIHFNEELLPSGKWKELIKTIPEGYNYLWHTNRGQGSPLFGWRTRYWSFLLKLNKKRPSWTLPANPGPATGPFHWKNRLLSSKELARLQTFPDDYEILGSYSAIRRQVGNAVPPLIGEILGKEIRVQWLDHKINEKYTFLRNRYSAKPTKSHIISVPGNFMHLVGCYRDHPGHGKGPGARLRKKLLRKGGIADASKKSKNLNRN